jgi:hypothetical protein
MPPVDEKADGWFIIGMQRMVNGLFGHLALSGTGDDPGNEKTRALQIDIRMAQALDHFQLAPLRAPKRSPVVIHLERQSRFLAWKKTESTLSGIILQAHARLNVPAMRVLIQVTELYRAQHGTSPARPGPWRRFSAGLTAFHHRLACKKLGASSAYCPVFED